MKKNMQQQCIDCKKIIDRYLKKQRCDKCYYAFSRTQNLQDKKDHYYNNLEFHREKSRAGNIKYKEQISKNKQQYYAKNRDKILAYYQQYYLDHAQEIISKNVNYTRQRKNKDIEYRIRYRLRSRLHSAIKGNFSGGLAIKELGCTISDFRVLLESKFQPGMTWDNKGHIGEVWHIDHIRPLSSFNLLDRNQIKLACHYTNLQPLWARDNLKKGKSY